MSGTVALTPVPVLQFNQGGVPLAGGLLFTYAAGTTTKIPTYTSATAATQNTNPVILDANGQCNCWLSNNTAYKLVLSPAGDTDPPTNPFWTVDNIINLVSLTNGGSINGNLTVNGVISASSLLLAYALTVPNGGTGVTFFTPGALVIGNSQAPLQTYTLGAGQLLVGQTAGVAPTGLVVPAGQLVLGAASGSSPGFLAPGTAGNIAQSNGSTWQSLPLPSYFQNQYVVTGSRARNTVYTNGNGRPMFVSISDIQTADSGTDIYIFYVGGVAQCEFNANIGTALPSGITGLVPAGATYEFATAAGTFVTWTETW